MNNNEQKMVKKIPVFDVTVSQDLEKEDGIFAIALVDRGAIQYDMVKFQKETSIIKFKAVSQDKHLIMSPVLIPGQYIYREDNKRGEYYLCYSKEAIELIVKKYFIHNQNNNFNLMHKDSTKTNAISLYESWIIDNPALDKSIEFFEGLPSGTLMQTYFCNTSSEQGNIIWNEFIQTGILKAISQEGRFGIDIIPMDMVEVAPSQQPELTINFQAQEQEEVIYSYLKEILAFAENTFNI